MHSGTSRWLSLRNAQQFGIVMQKGRIVARSRHFVLHALCWHHVTSPSTETPAHVRSTALFQHTHFAPVFLGTIIAKRWTRRAVTRNLIKRQIRHVMMDCIPILPNSLAIVVRQRAAFDTCKFTSASSSVLRTAVRQELLELAGSPDWHMIECLPEPAHRPICMTSKPFLGTTMPASGTMHPAP